MKIAGLFAGIGGLELAFGEEGFEAELLCEIDPAARAVLAARFPGVPLVDDVKAMSELPSDVRVVTAGFPCQDLSMAGSKTGLRGNKSSVVEHMFRLLEGATGVETVVVENVYFMLSLDRGRAMTRLVAGFERLGFNWAYRVLDTFDFGLPQRRRRVYMVASRTIDPRTALFDDEVAVEHLPFPTMTSPIGFYWTEGRSGVGFAADAIPPIKVGSSVGIPSTPAVLFPDGRVLTPSIEACERLQGFPPGWTAPGRGPGRDRSAWRLVGNAVSVPVARRVARLLRSAPMTAAIEGRPLASTQPWPKAAWNVGTGPAAPSAETRPRPLARPSIAAFLDPSWGKLSDRALDGFVGRAERGGIRMPSGFLDALRRAERKPVSRRATSPGRTPSTSETPLAEAAE